jgi:DNA-directed RNA polymerase subunit K/omega
VEIFTPKEAARHAGTKYRAILVAAKFARMLNEMPRDHQVQWDEVDRQRKLTTLAMHKLVDGDLGFKELRRRRQEV